MDRSALSLRTSLASMANLGARKAQTESHFRFDWRRIRTASFCRRPSGCAHAPFTIQPLAFSLSPSFGSSVVLRSCGPVVRLSRQFPLVLAISRYFSLFLARAISQVPSIPSETGMV